MGLLQKLKSALGFGGSRSRRGRERTDEVDVTVEHEPDATSEAAVKGSNGGWEEETVDGGSDADEGERSFGREEAAVAETAAGAAESAGAVEPGGDGTEDDPAETGSESAGGGARKGVPVDELSGIGPAYAERLGNAGVETVGDLAGADATTVAADSDISQGRVEGWIEQAREY
jgi:predicted flap endonuclease-1-like 5' DNA nuclease